LSNIDVDMWCDVEKEASSKRSVAAWIACFVLCPFLSIYPASHVLDSLVSRHDVGMVEVDAGVEDRNLNSVTPVGNFG